MRMVSPLRHKCGFNEKSAVLWRSGHSRTFHSTPKVNYTENWPFPVSWWCKVNKIDKKWDTMRMFSPLWQKRGFGEKSAVLWRSGNSRTFHSTPIVNYTENRPLSISCRSIVNKFGRRQIPCGCSDLSVRKWDKPGNEVPPTKEGWLSQEWRYL